MALTRSQKAARREARRLWERGDSMSLAPTPKRQKGRRNDRFVESTRESEDARMTVLNTRCRIYGLPVTEDARRTVLAPMMGDPAGVALRRGARDEAEAERLWETFCDIDRADEAFMRRIMGKARFAQSVKLELLPERFEARPDDKADARTSEEKDADAKAAWKRWTDRIECLSLSENLALWDGLRLRCELTRGGKLTTAGQTFVASMRLMHRMAERA